MITAKRRGASIEPLFGLLDGEFLSIEAFEFRVLHTASLAFACEWRNHSFSGATGQRRRGTIRFDFHFGRLWLVIERLSIEAPLLLASWSCCVWGGGKRRLLTRLIKFLVSVEDECVSRDSVLGSFGDRGLLSTDFWMLSLLCGCGWWGWF